ncbi:MAG: hypothetical protein V8S74_00190 [Lachnospirales bacterium]
MIEKIYSGKEFFSYCYNNSELYGCLWLNFYKSSVIKEKRLIEKIVYEDTPVIFEVFNSDIKVKYIKDQLLYHRLNYNSVMRSSMNNMKIRSNILGMERMLLLYNNDIKKTKEQLLFIRWVASTHFTGLRALERFDIETKKLCRRFNEICIKNRKLLSKSLFKEYIKLFIKSPIKAFKAIL